MSAHRRVWIAVAVSAALVGVRPVRAADEVGVRAESAATVQAFGAQGISQGAANNSAGAAGESLALAGPSHGVVARSASPQGFAGFFQNAGGGDLLRGSADGTVVFRVSNTGVVTATSWNADGRGLFQFGDVECNGCIDGGKLAVNGVTASDLAVGAVASSRIADGAVGGAEIAAAAILAGHLGAGSVTATKLLENAVTTAELADSSVRGENLFNGAVDRVHLAEESVTRAKIDGSERPVYLLEPGCPDDGFLTSDARCLTEECSASPLSHWNCSRTSCVPGDEQTCLLDVVGYVLSASTLP